MNIKDVVVVVVLCSGRPGGVETCHMGLFLPLYGVRKLYDMGRKTKKIKTIQPARVSYFKTE